MKKIYSLIFALCIIASASFASGSQGSASVAANVQLTKQATKKLSLTQKIAFKLVEKKIDKLSKKDIKDVEENKDTKGEGIDILGFLLGFFFGLLGVLAAVILKAASIGQDNIVKSSLFGLLAAILLLIIVVILIL